MLADRQKDKQTARQTDRQTERERDRQTDRQTARRRDSIRQTDRHTQAEAEMGEQDRHNEPKRCFFVLLFVRNRLKYIHCLNSVLCDSPCNTENNSVAVLSVYTER